LAALTAQAQKNQNINQQANVTTKQGQQTVKSMALAQDDLTKQQEKLNKALSRHNIRLKELQDATRQANLTAKNQAKLNKAAEGSYNQLSAQYSKNKQRLNAMSKEQRFATKQGRLLEAQTRRLYEQMNKLATSNRANIN
jgi:chromosome segregation ATPase